MESLVKKADFVFYAISGGRDSQAALELTFDEYKKQGKKIYLLHVDTQSERAGTLEHAERIAASVGEPLHVLAGPSFFDLFGKDKKWPSPIWRPCLQNMINKPVDAFIKEKTQGEYHIIVRGGRKDQRTRNKEHGAFRMLKSKPKTIFHEPLNALPEYEAKGPVWPGYSKGYSRTQCWCCPFASVADFENMRKADPDQWDKVRKMFEEYEWTELKNDGYLKRLRAYWEGQHGIKMNIKERAKNE